MSRKIRKAVELMGSRKMWGFVNWGFDSFEICTKYAFI